MSQTSDQKPTGINEAINLISLHPTLIVRVLGALGFFLLLINIALQLTFYLAGQTKISVLARFFYFDSEDNVPSAYSTFLLLISALLLTVITLLKKNQKGSMVSHWAVLSAGFVFMALDEQLSFHEQLIIPLRAVLDADNYGVFYYAWVIPAIILVVVVGLFFLKFLKRLPAKTTLRFVVAGALYIGGSIGIELIGGRYHELYGQSNLTYSMIATFEESLEMTGILVFIWALLEYISDNFKVVQFQLRGKVKGRD